MNVSPDLLVSCDLGNEDDVTAATGRIYSPDSVQSSNQQPATSNRQPAIGNQQSAIGNQQSAISNRQSAIGNQQSAISNRQSAIHLSHPSQSSLYLRRRSRRTPG
jgi:hypothetical protein